MKADGVMETDRLHWLVMTDVDAIQTYLFSSIWLSTIAGASQIVANNDRQIKKIVGALEGTTLFSAGGAGLVLLPGETDDVAKEFIRQATTAFSQASVAGHLSTSAPIDRRNHPSFSKARDAAAESLEFHKRLGHPVGEAGVFPMTRRCDACGNEAVTQSRRFGDETHWLGPACLAKWEARDRSWLNLLTVQPEWTGLRREHLAEDFNVLAGNDYLAVIVADVNGVGVRLRTIQSPFEFTSFSKGMAEAVRSALSAALLEAVAPGREAILTGEAKLPVQVLYHGGDDIVVACRGKLALPLMQTLVETFAVQAHEDWAEGKPLGMSAGVVLTHPKFPFRTAHRIAERLLAEAKRTARAEGWSSGAVDFAIVSESYATADAILADRLIKAEESSLSLTGRPLNVSSGPRSLRSFADACRYLAQQRFPRNQLFDLRKYCAASTWEPVTKAYQVRERQEELQEALRAWRTRIQRRPEKAQLWDNVLGILHLAKDGFYPSNGSEWRTPLGDLADAIGLWDKERS
jgi:hypothetical protein